MWPAVPTTRRRAAATARLLPEPLYLGQLLLVVLSEEEIPLRAPLGDSTLLGLDSTADGLFHGILSLQLGLQGRHNPLANLVLLPMVIDTVVLQQRVQHE